MKLLLTGGTGFFGRALLKYVDAGEQSVEVTVLTRNPVAFLNNHSHWASAPWLRLQVGDVTLADTLAPLAGSDRFTHVLHAATDLSAASGLTELERMDQIVNGTRNMLNFTSQQGIQRFLLTSSGSVYGPQPQGLGQIPETYLGMPSSMLPNSTYGVAKRMAEHLCALAASETSVATVVARCFAFVGEDLPQDAHFAVGNFIRDALHRSAIEVNGDGSPLRSYMCQSDLAHWLLTMLQKGQSGEAYNVGSNQAISIGELAHMVRDIVAPEKKVHIRGVTQANNAQRDRYIPDITKACETLGLAVTVPIQEAIALAANRIRCPPGFHDT